jgi:hypothetical protein
VCTASSATARSGSGPPCTPLSREKSENHSTCTPWRCSAVTCAATAACPAAGPRTCESSYDRRAPAQSLCWSRRTACRVVAVLLQGVGPARVALALLWIARRGQVHVVVEGGGGEDGVWRRSARPAARPRTLQRAEPRRVQPERAELFHEVGVPPVAQPGGGGVRPVELRRLPHPEREVEPRVVEVDLLVVEQGLRAQRPDLQVVHRVGHRVDRGAKVLGEPDRVELGHRAAEPQDPLGEQLTDHAVAEEDDHLVLQAAQRALEAWRPRWLWAHEIALALDVLAGLLHRRRVEVEVRVKSWAAPGQRAWHGAVELHWRILALAALQLAPVRQ